MQNLVQMVDQSSFVLGNSSCRRCPVEKQTALPSSGAVGFTIAQNLAVVIGHRLHLFQTMWLREMQRAVEVLSA